MADKFEDLRTYVTVVTCGGVNAAASELGIAKSAVSRRLSDLEARLGVSLIERARRGFEVTALGRDYFRQATEILARLEEMDAVIAAPAADAIVTITASPPLLIHLVAPALAAIRKRADLPAIDLVRFEPARIGDVTLTYDRDAAEGFDTRPVRTVGTMVCAAPAYLAERGTPQSPTDLAEHHAIVIVDAARTDWTFGDTAPRRPTVSLRVPDEETALAAAVAGLGLVQLPDFVVAKAIADGRLSAVLTRHSPSPRPLVARFATDAPATVLRLVDDLSREVGGDR